MDYEGFEQYNDTPYPTNSIMPGNINLGHTSLTDITFGELNINDATGQVSYGGGHDINVTPPFYKQKWFIPAALVFGAILILK